MLAYACINTILYALVQLFVKWIYIFLKCPFNISEEFYASLITFPINYNFRVTKLYRALHSIWNECSIFIRLHQELKTPVQNNYMYIALYVRTTEYKTFTHYYKTHKTHTNTCKQTHRHKHAVKQTHGNKHAHLVIK